LNMKSITSAQLESLIYAFRDYRVMLDSDLAKIYGVETRVLNQAVSRNAYRFPEDFAFRLSKGEWKELQELAPQSKGSGGRRKRPYVFTEQGVAMLSSVLNSKQAISANVQIMRTFVRIRNVASAYKELEEKIASVEKNSDANYRLLVQALLKLKEQVEPALPGNRRKIGIRTTSKKKRS